MGGANTGALCRLDRAEKRAQRTGPDLGTGENHPPRFASRGFPRSLTPLGAALEGVPRPQQVLSSANPPPWYPVPGRVGTDGPPRAQDQGLLPAGTLRQAAAARALAEGRGGEGRVGSPAVGGGSGGRPGLHVPSSYPVGLAGVGAHAGGEVVQLPADVSGEVPALEAVGAERARRRVPAEAQRGRGRRCRPGATP